MKNTIVHHEGAASLEAARTKIKLCASIIKIGLDVHARLYVAVAQYDQLLPKPARRLAPSEFVPWVRLVDVSFNRNSRATSEKHRSKEAA